jgi:hypothetical protein
MTLTLFDNTVMSTYFCHQLFQRECDRRWKHHLLSLQLIIFFYFNFLFLEKSPLFYTPWIKIHLEKLLVNMNHYSFATQTIYKYIYIYILKGEIFQFFFRK